MLMMRSVTIMLNRKLIFNGTVTLFNYIGEENGIAKYAKAILKNVKFEKQVGKSAGGNGRNPDNSATLYFFDRVATVTDVDGKCKTYLRSDVFAKADNPYSFFTFRNGNDYVVEGICLEETPKFVNAYRITLAARYESGTRRMHHWRCDCR